MKPGFQKVKPPPFKRPSIEGGRHGRVWQEIDASQLRVGDVVKDKGLIESIEDRSEWDKIEVFFLSRDSVTYELDSKVTAFSRKPSLTTDEQ